MCPPLHQSIDGISATTSKQDVIGYIEMRKTPGRNGYPTVHPILVTIGDVSSDGSNEPSLRFSVPFRIGRSADCEVCIQNAFVSRVHAEVVPENGGWRVCDLNSSNGLYQKGDRVDNILVISTDTLRLGEKGPEVSFRVVEEASQPGEESPGSEVVIPSRDENPEDEIVARYAERYFREPNIEEAIGEHTMYVRRAFAKVQNQQKEVQTKQKRLFLGIITALLLGGIAVSIWTLRLYVERKHQSELARNLFYAMKSMDVEIAAAERLALASSDRKGQEEVDNYEAKRKEMLADYDRFLATLHIYDPRATEQHRLILRVSRIFGECELDMPPDFEQEIMKYIGYWKSSGRFARDVRLAHEKGYTEKIPQALLQHGLPVQFFYLAMQESDFDPYASGPMTRKGIAKGMWQFIPETGIKYGLHLGPLVDLGRPDPADEREQVDKATDAATRYIAMLYGTDAQASGLLVMACYNWGEDQVLPLVRSMPASPRERNFWKLLADHRNQIPQQTYDYVFYITSAAVIGENPRLFGFDFDNPLESSTLPGRSQFSQLPHGCARRSFQPTQPGASKTSETHLVPPEGSKSKNIAGVATENGPHWRGSHSAWLQVASKSGADRSSRGG